MFKIGVEAKIEQVERRLRDKKQLLEDVQNEFDLLERQAFETYVNNICYLQLDQKGFIDKSKDWIKMQTKNIDKNGNKLDKRKHYQEKDVYDYYIGKIKEILNINDMKNIEFLDYNFGQATIVRFTHSNKDWELIIPHINTISFDKYKTYGANVFKLKINVKISSCCWETIKSTFDENELKNVIKGNNNEVEQEKDA